jgi:cyclic pyranopterin phosphate synthase
VSANAELPGDRLGRPLHDLRISVTDRCNFRCSYCMPREVFGLEYPFLPRREILSFEEIARVARLFTRLGVEKLRLTGGEPLLRKELERLVAMLADVEGVRDLALTTNGSLLGEKARCLRAAGLQRVTVSLDALDPEIFARMADAALPVERVIAGIEAARAAGFSPIKLNMVVKRGVNEGEILPLVRRFGGPGFVLRFIEYMDVGNTNGWRVDEVVPMAEILAVLAGDSSLTALPPQYGGEVARRFRTPGGAEIGVISSVTQPFCRACTRARLSADGRLYTCLFASEGFDLRTPLRSGASDQDLEELIRGIWTRRSDRYSELRGLESAGRVKAEMSLLGG